MRNRFAVTGVIAIVLALVAAGVWLLGGRDLLRSDLQQAVSLAPAGTERLSWTDWEAIRAETGSEVSASSSAGESADFLDEAYEADLSSTSALVQSAPALHAQFGFSPASLEWELLSQSTQGAAVIMKLPDTADFDELAGNLEQLGYTPPASETGPWLGGPDTLARISGVLTPELQYVALDPDRGLVIASDTRSYLTRAVAVATGEGERLESLDDVVAASGEPLSAALYTGARACQELAMSAADEQEQQQAEALVESAGEVNPVTGFAMTVQPGGDVRVVMSFETEDQARTNADSRAVLAGGPAPGQGGDFADRFAVSSVTADGELVTMALDPVRGQYVLSDLSTGPLLFATC